MRDGAVDRDRSVHAAHGRFGRRCLWRCASPRPPVRVLLLLAMAMFGSMRPVSAEPVPPAEATAGLVAALQARILSGHSATAVLEAWCAERGLSADPHLVARRISGPDKPLDAAQRQRLGLAPDEPVRYRRVRLACGVHVLSEADNWYVPGRLTPAMNAALDETDAPFGRVVRPLEPTRRNVALRPLRDPDAPPPGPDDPLFEIDAVLATGAGLPFCEVAETYLGAVLGRGL
ncbi:hypothetical protein AFCDBAGC_4260 [Methylobacterium cerastii]|uniref:Uncharacterized protein n=3 Tax=Methylobacterium TaxID=407 RepID=A0ABQ4QM98_9HYPH|nr:hypothetical protein AFCDBAGC_4260 [Methylobacterium cerastii]